MRHLRTFVSLFLTLCLLTSCLPGQTAATTDNKNFTQLTDQIFCSLVSSDSLTLNYTLSNPEKYGIVQLPDGLPAYSGNDSEENEDAVTNENLLSSIESFSRSSLSREQQILYDCLTDSLKKTMESQKYSAFSESLGPTTGIQAQLPVLMAEFRIENLSDLEQYFSLIGSIPGFFDSICISENKKKETGTLPSRGTLTRIAGQCQDFLDGRGYRMISDVFQKKIDSADFLTDEKKEEMLKKHESLITEALIPAYRALIDCLKKLQPFAVEDGNLSSYKGGSDYYNFLVQSVTGSSRPLDEWEGRMKKQLKDSKDTLLSIAAKDASLFSSCQSYVTKFRTPEQILEHLKKTITKDFPSLQSNAKTINKDADDVGITYEIKQVDPSLEDNLSPAFYLTPPIDDPQNQVIYINPSNRYDTSSLFNTLAHEGFPGHLYQTSYFLNKNISPLRHLLDYGGYTEGWATYAELYSYRYTGVSSDEISILQNNMMVSLCLYGLCDIGVHAHGWSKKDLLTFLQQYGNWDDRTAASVYTAVIDEPASYLKYTIGYLEILNLKDKMKSILGDSFSDKQFHTYLLEMGPCPFSLLENELGAWCRKAGHTE